MAKMQGGFFENLPQVEGDEGRHRKTAGRSAESQGKQTTEESDKNAASSSSVDERQQRRGRPRKDLVREGKNKGLAKGYERFTLVADSEMLTWYRDYAYTYRVSMREALETALAQFKDEHASDELQEDPKFH